MSGSGRWGAGPSTGKDGILTKETQALLSGLLKESNVSRRQKEQLLSDAGIRTPGSLQNPSRTVSGHAAQAKPKVALPRVGLGAPRGPSPPERFSGRRSHQEILIACPPARERYDGTALKPGRDREAEKTRLQTKFELSGLSAEEAAERMARGERKGGPGASGRVRQAPMGVDELHDAILGEVKERWDHLEEMRRGGNANGREYEATIRGEIGQRVAQLRRLEGIAKRQEELNAEAAAGGTIIGGPLPGHRAGAGRGGGGAGA